MDNDYMTKSGALKLAAEIQLYWAAKGIAGVEVWIEEVYSPEHDAGELYQVRSNIVEKILEHTCRDSVLQRSGYRSVH